MATDISIEWRTLSKRMYDQENATRDLSYNFYRLMDRIEKLEEKIREMEKKDGC